MIMRVNKRISSPAVDYAALLSGTVSHVWHDEESDSKSKPKRKNHIRVKRESSESVSDYDA